MNDSNYFHPPARPCLEVASGKPASFPASYIQFIVAILAVGLSSDLSLGRLADLISSTISEAYSRRLITWLQ
jgi:hypothetical protein